MSALYQLYFLKDGSSNLPHYIAVQRLHSLFSLQYVTGCFACMCYDSKEFTDDLDNSCTIYSWYTNIKIYFCT